MRGPALSCSADGTLSMVAYEDDVCSASSTLMVAEMNPTSSCNPKDHVTATCVANKGVKVKNLPQVELFTYEDGSSCTGAHIGRSNIKAGLCLLDCKLHCMSMHVIVRVEEAPPLSLSFLSLCITSRDSIVYSIHYTTSVA